MLPLHKENKDSRDKRPRNHANIYIAIFGNYLHLGPDVYMDNIANMIYQFCQYSIQEQHDVYQK